MLTKLLAHEWKDTWKLVGILNLLVVALSVVGCFFLNNEVWTNASDNEFVVMTNVLYLMFYVVLVSMLCAVVFYYFFIRFYRNLFTDQGYLMHTLPVTSHQIIWSKAIVALSWMLISALVTFGSIMSMIIAAVSSEGVLEELKVAFSEINMDGKGWIIIIEYILFILVSQFMSIFMGYASISLGQTFKRHKILGAIGVYIGIYMIIQIVSSYLSIFMSMSAVNMDAMVNQADPTNMMMVMLLALLIVVGLLGAGFYFLTNYVVENKLNLE